MDNAFGQRLLDLGYHLFFNFTINSEAALLEPKVPPLADRLNQLEQLCLAFSSACVTWRFDPVCFYQTATGGIQDNLHDFSRIADKVAGCGVTRCITSFMDDYPKIRKRTGSIRGFDFVDPPLEAKRIILLDMNKTLAARNIELFTCCEKELLETLPSNLGIKPSSCIPNRLLVDLFGGNLSFKKDLGQRIQGGCGCQVSSDIGSYPLHPCYHDCLFCYANPASAKSTKKPTDDTDV